MVSQFQELHYYYSMYHCCITSTNMSAAAVQHTGDSSNTDLLYTKCSISYLCHNSKTQLKHGLVVICSDLNPPTSATHAQWRYYYYSRPCVIARPCY